MFLLSTSTDFDKIVLKFFKYNVFFYHFFYFLFSGYSIIDTTIMGLDTIDRPIVPNIITMKILTKLSMENGDLGHQLANVHALVEVVSHMMCDNVTQSGKDFQ